MSLWRSRTLQTSLRDVPVLRKKKKMPQQRTPPCRKPHAPWVHAGKSPGGCCAPGPLRPLGEVAVGFRGVPGVPASSGVLLFLLETRHIISRAPICHVGSIAAVCWHLVGYYFFWWLPWASGLFPWSSGASMQFRGFRGPRTRRRPSFHMASYFHCTH